MSKLKNLTLCDVLIELKFNYLLKGYDNMKIQIVDCINFSYVGYFKITDLYDLTNAICFLHTCCDLSLDEKVLAFEIYKSKTLCTIFI